MTTKLRLNHITLSKCAHFSEAALSCMHLPAIVFREKCMCEFVFVCVCVEEGGSFERPRQDTAAYD